MQIESQKGQKYCMNCSGKKDLENINCYVIRVRINLHLCDSCIEELIKVLKGRGNDKNL